MKVYIIFALIITLIFSGCSTVLKSADSLANITVAHEQITSGQVSQTIKAVELTETEKLTVDHAINNYIAFAGKWKSKIKELDSRTPIFSEFLLDYDNLVKQYTSVESIINKNWASYSPRYQVLLLDYQLRAKKINNNVDSLIINAQVYSAVYTAIELAAVLAGAMK